MRQNQISVFDAIKSIREVLYKAHKVHLRVYEKNKADEEHYLNYDQDEDVLLYLIESAFVRTLILLDVLGMTQTYGMVMSVYKDAKKNFSKSLMGEEEPYLVWSEKISMFIDGLSDAYGYNESVDEGMSYLKKIISRSLYHICDSSVFNEYPKNEADVHDRIEGVLKCIFSDVRTKPPVAKPIKNFFPDTGLPLLKILIEYKYIANTGEAKRVVDEILADSNGYVSSEWHHLLFVIYETTRIKSEEEWGILLKKSGLDDHYDILVLTGNNVASMSEENE
jgi:hypothetical protein